MITATSTIQVGLQREFAHNDRIRASRLDFEKFSHWFPTLDVTRMRLHDAQTRHKLGASRVVYCEELFDMLDDAASQDDARVVVSVEALSLLLAQKIVYLRRLFAPRFDVRVVLFARRLAFDAFQHSLWSQRARALHDTPPRTLRDRLNDALAAMLQARAVTYRDAALDTWRALWPAANFPLCSSTAVCGVTAARRLRALCATRSAWRRGRRVTPP